MKKHQCTKLMCTPSISSKIYSLLYKTPTGASINCIHHNNEDTKPSYRFGILLLLIVSGCTLCVSGPSKYVELSPWHPPLVYNFSASYFLDLKTSMHMTREDSIDLAASPVANTSSYISSFRHPSAPSAASCFNGDL